MSSDIREKHLNDMACDFGRGSIVPNDLMFVKEPRRHIATDIVQIPRAVKVLQDLP